MSLLRALGLPAPTTSPRTSTDGKGTAGAAAAAGPKSERLAQAAANWRDVHTQADKRIDTLKKAIQAHYAGGHPQFLQEIEKGVGKLDDVLANVDHSLADVMASAAQADDAARKTELENAKAMLTRYIGYVAKESLIAHMDQNPFGVKMDLKALLSTGLREAAKAIG